MRQELSLRPCASGIFDLVRLVVFVLIVAVHTPLFSQTPLASQQDLKKLSLEELMNIEIVSVSKHPEKLTEVASAIQVITADDIRRSGARSIPEALRLASNLQVGQLNSSAWIISARGFNALFSNKLLVMIDGRTVYSPLFAGVFWDVQSVLLEDVERIEVISGPGGTMWGANAVNGVINIITKNTSRTKGLYVEAGGGTFHQGFGAVRYGGEITPEFSYRVYAQHTDRDNTFFPDGKHNSDGWRLSQTGLSFDWNPDERNTVVVRTNFYGGTHETLPSESTVDGQNVLARWSRRGVKGSDLSIQAYYDRTWRRDSPSTISDGLDTWDIDLQHRFAVGTRHELILGGGYRLMRNETLHATDFVALLPPRRTMDLFSTFIQDEISLVPDRLKFVVGTKLQHHEFSDFEFQPSARLAWTTSRHTLWGAVSRAVRAPSRIDVDYFIPAYPVPSHQPSVAGGPNFTSEKLTAVEMGYRVQPAPQVSISLATFYNRYDDLYSVEALPNTLTYQIQNGTEGKSRGVELAGRIQVSDIWRFNWGYTYFYKELKNKPGHVYDFSALGNDPENQFRFHSILDLPGNVQLDHVVRYTDTRPNPFIYDYFTFDTRLGWMYKTVTVSVVGQNLWRDKHTEFSFQIPRSVYAKVECRL